MSEMTAQHRAYWAQYDYTRPIAEHLSKVFGVTFAAENTGGGCICIASEPMEGGLYILVGSAFDGPLLTAQERADYLARNGYPDGYGVGVYDEQEGYSKASAVDWKAQTPEQVAELARRALGLVAQATDSTYPEWVRSADGSVSDSTKRA